MGMQLLRTSLLAFCWPLLLGAVIALPAATETTVISHVRLIDGTGAAPRSNMTVIFTDGMIQSIGPDSGASHSGRKVPAGAHVIDGQGLTMMPGLINAHGHLALVDGTENSATYYTLPHVLAELRQYEHYGVVEMLSLGLNRNLIYQVRAQQKAGTLDGAAVFVADHGIGVDGGAPPLQHSDDQLDQPRSPLEAREAVDAADDRHTDLIKVWVDDLYGTKPKMQPAIYQAVIDEAHKRHLPVAAHMYYLEDAKALVRAGVDVLAHSVRDQPVDAEFIELMKQHGTWYIPTLTVDDSFFAFADHPELLEDPFLVKATTPEELAKLKGDDYQKKVASDKDTPHHRTDLAMASKNLKRLYDAGVHIGFGTDSGANPMRLPGYAEHRELQLMVAAGLTPVEAIHCATANNATILGIDSQTGTLAPSKKADFLLVQGDPARAISDTEKMVSIWHNGFEGKPWATHAMVAAGSNH
jgi:imidazolonepropionase-like amidohydrolase